MVVVREIRVAISVGAIAEGIVAEAILQCKMRRCGKGKGLTPNQAKSMR